MEIIKIYIGGWFQRTTLHLAEIWQAFNEGETDIDLDIEKLKKLIKILQIKSISRHTEILDYILVETEKINYRIHEDGLIILEKTDVSDIATDLKTIKEYYDNCLSPFISYLFSKGAPVPKELADIKTILPYIIITKGAEEEIKSLFKKLEEWISSEVRSESVGVYRGPNLIVINNIENADIAQAIVESQIFFREFKTQLHRYLSIHRIVWEKIAFIKEQASIRGAKITELRNQLTDYQKTITLIGTRIKQMDVYLTIRAKIASDLKLDGHLKSLFQYKYETLESAHKYIQHLWEMTESYLNSAIQVFVELEEKTSKDVLSSLRIVTSIGVIAAIFGYLAQENLPKFTSQGLIYFGLIFFLTWLLNEIISQYYRKKYYKMIIETEGRKTKF